MDLTMPAQRERVTDELRKAIRHINRNLYEWKSEKGSKPNFTISYNEVYSVTKNWIIRCLRGVTDSATIDRVIRAGHILIQMDEINLCLAKITIAHPDSEQFTSSHRLAKILDDIFSKMDYVSLKYDPKQYAADGVSTRTDPFYYPPYEPMSITTVKYDSLKPKN